MTTEEILLQVEDLRTTFHGPHEPVRAVNGVSFSLRRGERLGIAGESGSGKSVTALSMIGLVHTPPAEVRGKAIFDGVDLLSLSDKQMRRVRGARIGMIFQNPLSCLSPAMKIGDQIVEAIRAHENVSRREGRDRAVALLSRVGLPSPAANLDEYPHRFSGGMRQRVMIAIALSCNPDLVIADEPTTALDVTIEAQIIELLTSACAERGAALILITHDLGILAGSTDRIAIMYSGAIVEEGPVDKIYYGATHPYTWGLMSSLTRLDRPRMDRLVPIEGNPPSPASLPSGCRFHPRCPYVQSECRQRVPLLDVHDQDDHPSACHFAGRLRPPASGRATAG